MPWWNPIPRPCILDYFLKIEVIKTHDKYNIVRSHNVDPYKRKPNPLHRFQLLLHFIEKCHLQRVRVIFKCKSLNSVCTCSPLIILKINHILFTPWTSGGTCSSPRQTTNVRCIDFDEKVVCVRMQVNALGELVPTYRLSRSKKKPTTLQLLP